MAQTQLYVGKTQIHLVEESSQDTFEAPGGSGTNIFMAQNVSISFDSSNYESPAMLSGYLKPDEVPGSMSATISFEVPIRGSGSAGTAPEFGEALKACGMEDTTTPATSVVYTPLSTFDGTGGNPGPSYSTSILMNGVRHSLKGGFGTFSISADVDGPGIIAFQMTGAYNAFADDGLESPTYDTTQPPSFRGASFATNFGGSYTPKGVNGFTFDLGNQISIIRDVNDSSGILGARIVGRKSTGEFNAELTLAATNNYFSVQRAGTTGTITTGTIGGTAGNQWAFAVNRSVLRPISVSDRDGIAIQTIPFAVSSNYTDVEGTNADISLTFT